VRKVLVQPEHVRDCPFQLGVGAALDSEVSVVFGDAHCARPARLREGGLEHPARKVDEVRRKLRDTVRHDRAREVDGLATRPDKGDLSGGRQRLLAVKPRAS
jgi:hypothetical protein